MKNFPFTIDLEEIQKIIDGTIDIKSNSIDIGDSSIFYISISKSEELVMVDKTPYKINDKGNIEELEIQKVFISYTHKDSDLADYAEEKLSLYQNLKITRDINITQYKDSLSEFMQTIRTHDIVIAIVTDAYIKSLNCMYEITQLMKDVDYQERLYFIIVREEDSKFYSEKKKYESFQANIYSFEGSLAYLKYWDKEQKKLEDTINSAGLRPSMLSNIALEMQKVESVLPSINDFIFLLKDRVGKSFQEIYEEEFKDIVKKSRDRK